MSKHGKIAQLLSQFANTTKMLQFNCKPNYRNVTGVLSTFEKPLRIQRTSQNLHLGVYVNMRSFRFTIPLWSLSDQEIKKYMDGISAKFGEAMELLSDARSSMGTIYFSEDMTDAEAMIDEVLKEYEYFLGLLTDSQSKDVMRAIGLKMEELKAQLQLLKESIKD